MANRTIVLVSQAQSHPKSDEVSDLNRALTDYGQFQAQDRGKRLLQRQLGDCCFGDHGIILTSPAKRSQQTAYAIASEAPTLGCMQLSTVKSLYPSEAMVTAFKKHGLVPMSAYHQDPQTKSSIVDTGSAMVADVRDFLRANQGSGGPVLVSTHPVMITAMLLEMPGIYFKEKQRGVQHILDYLIGECEGYLVKLDDGFNVVHFEFLRNT